MNKIYIIFLLLISLQSLATEDITAHSHYTKWEYFLNNEYPNVTIEIKLHEETDDVKFLSASFNGKKIKASHAELLTLKNIELSTLKAIYANHCKQSWEEPFEISEDRILEEQTNLNTSKNFDCIILKVSRDRNYSDKNKNTKNESPNSFLIKIIPEDLTIRIEENPFF